MLTYSFEDKGNDTLYEYLYKQIKKDIISGKLIANEKLPSKRMLARHLNISTITVETAYSQLVAEGYIYSIPKSGFYVCDIETGGNCEIYVPLDKHRPMENSSNVSGKVTNILKENNSKKKEPEYYADFVNNRAISENFPFATWTKLMRDVMADDTARLLNRPPSAGIYELRVAIASYLYQFRGMSVEPEQIVIGAGTEYLYGLIIQLLGHDRCYGVEDPGYQKIARIYQAHDVKWCHIAMDENGIDMGALIESEADVLHISPSHHFPTGLVTPVSRRYELLSWASKSSDRYIIEDEYDSEFRLTGKPVPALQSIDVSDKVIYINTFSKSLASTIRISYMVLPEPLVEKYNKELSFYACTVSNFDQYTLMSFINGGYLEKHINRMRNYYRSLRDKILSTIRNHECYNRVTIKEENAGLHFLLKLATDYNDSRIVDLAAQYGIHISCLSQYYYDIDRAVPHTLVVNYSGIGMEYAEEAIDRLFKSLFGQEHDKMTKGRIL
ncbi:MAG: PLP-dependent aminotransferase family protein [Coprococcus sp.]